MRLRSRANGRHAATVGRSPRIAVMLGEDRRIRWQFQALARKGTETSRQPDQDLALAHLLLNGFRQNLH